MALHNHSLSPRDLGHTDQSPKGLEESGDSFDELDIETEIVTHFFKTKDLRADVAISDAPFNQKAQVFNSLTSTLDKLVRLQASIHNSDRQKQVEKCLVAAMRTCPMPVQDAFFESYDRLVKNYDKSAAKIAKLE